MILAPRPLAAVLALATLAGSALAGPYDPSFVAIPQNSVRTGIVQSANGLSADGTVVVGQYAGNKGYRWSAATGTLLFEPASDEPTAAFAVSSDGLRTVGQLGTVAASWRNTQGGH